MWLRQSRASDLALTPSLGVRALGGFGTSIVGGAALGAAAWSTDQLGFPWTALLPFNAIGAWVAVAFVLGASARTIPTGARRLSRPARTASGFAASRAGGNGCPGLMS